MRYRRILLINPPVTLEQVYGPYASGAPVLPPLGFCYVATALLKLGYEVELLDCVAEKSSLQDIKRRVERFQPHIVGLTSTTVSFYYAKEVISLVKGLDSKVMTILGGAHVSAVPKEAMEECPGLDVGVYGEGELTIQELLQTLEEGGALSRVSGLCYREGGQVRVNPPRANAKDLDQFDMPARHLLKDLRLYSPNPFRGFSNAVSLISSRGCTFDCSYCDQSVFVRRWRAHTADYVVREIKYLMRTWDFDFFSFEDDHFLINRERVVNLCKKIVDEKLQIGWTCSTRANAFTPESLEWMKRAGCKIVYLGIEAGSPRMLDLIDKGITLEQVRRGVDLCKAHGIDVYGAFMIGSPTETKEDINATLEFALSLPLDAISCFIYVPYPATPLRALALKNGRVSADWRDYSAHPTRLPYIQDGLTEEYLLQQQREFYRKFYLRIGHIVRHLPHYSDWRSFKKVARSLGDFCLNRRNNRHTPGERDAPGGVAVYKRDRLHT